MSADGLSNARIEEILSNEGRQWVDRWAREVFKKGPWEKSPLFKPTMPKKGDQWTHVPKPWEVLIPPGMMGLWELLQRFRWSRVKGDLRNEDPLEQIKRTAKGFVVWAIQSDLTRNGFFVAAVGDELNVAETQLRLEGLSTDPESMVARLRLINPGRNWTIRKYYHAVRSLEESLGDQVGDETGDFSTSARVNKALVDEAEKIPSAESSLVAKEKLAEAFALFSERDKEILLLFHVGKEGKTFKQTEIASMYGISQGLVSQIVKKAKKVYAPDTKDGSAKSEPVHLSDYR